MTDEQSQGRTVFCELVFPEHMNHHGTLIGGRTLHLMDLAAFASASRVARATLVTAACKDVAFLAPLYKGELAEVCAKTVEVEGRRFFVEVEVHAENLLTGERRLCATGAFTCVQPKTLS